ncbi:Uncharacterised protein [Pseudomonas aeruginosa]|nr:Uncharacterised protein [Pseudomonas aeruginosa]
MKLDKAAAIAQLNQALGMSVLDAGNTLLARFNKSKNVWWFDIPLSPTEGRQVPQPAAGEPGRRCSGAPEGAHRFSFASSRTAWNCATRTPARPTLSLELSADPGKRLRDVRPGGAGLDFAPFLQP